MNSAMPQVSEVIEEFDCINEVLEKMNAVLDQLDAIEGCKIPALRLHQAIEHLRLKAS